MEESGKSSPEDKLFQRVDCKTNLRSQPSLITLMLVKNELPDNQASKSTSALPRSRMANDPLLDSDEAPLVMNDRNPKPIHKVASMTGPNNIQPPTATTPRTTRRSMLATELTESLRRHLLWERQQKASTANAVLKRRHTSQNVANLKQYPEKSRMKKSEVTTIKIGSR